jgi:hypothetical protein
MKKHKNIILTLLVILLTQSIAFADNPNDFGGDDLDENPLDKPKEALPIDTNQWVLLSAGLLYGYSIYKTRSKPN